MTPLSREDALTRLRQSRALQPGEGTMQVATRIVDTILDEGEREYAHATCPCGAPQSQCEGCMIEDRSILREAPS